MTMETYGKEPKKKENLLVKIWNKTVFSDMVKNKRDRKALERRLRAEVAEEAQPEIEAAMKKKYKQELISKMKGEKKKSGKGVMDKIAAGFGADPNAPRKEVDIAGMMGMGGSNTNPEDKLGMGGTSIASDEKIKSILGTSNRGAVLDEEIEKKKTKSKKKKTKKKQTEEKEEENNPFDVSDKIAKMLE